MHSGAGAGAADEAAARNGLRRPLLSSNLAAETTFQLVFQSKGMNKYTLAENFRHLPAVNNTLE
jgi:hypothetical protein